MAQVPGLVTMQAGSLSCGVVMRASDTIQTYCYAPGTPLKLIYNGIAVIHYGMLVPVNHCTVELPIGTPCPIDLQDTFTAQYTALPNGIQYQLSAKGLAPMLTGVLNAIFGAKACGSFIDGVCRAFAPIEQMHANCCQ